MKTKLYKAITIISLMLSMVIILSACGTDNSQSATGTEKKTIKIAYLPITHALPLHVESELGKSNLKNLNIELIKFGSWPELMDALNTGKVDGASVLIELAMKAKEQGIDLKTVALGHRDGNVVVVANNINKVSDLKGKTFAIPHRLSTHNILLYKMLQKERVTEKDVKIIELPPAEMPAALAEGRISGYIVAEPFGAKAIAMNKGKVLYQSNDLWQDSVCCGLVLRNDFIKNNPEITQEFVNEYAKAGIKADLKDKQIQDIASNYMRVEPTVLNLSMKWISFNDLKLREDDYNRLRENLIEMGLAKNPPQYKDFVDSTFIDKVK